MILDPLAGLVERGRQQVATARFVGKFAVDRAVAKLQRRLDPHPHGSVPVIESIALSTADDPSEAALAETSAAQPDADRAITTLGSIPSVTDLVLPDYDHLPAAHVVSKLPTLTERERAGIERYELAHRHRRTILGKIEQLRAT